MIVCDWKLHDRLRMLGRQFPPAVVPYNDTTVAAQMARLTTRFAMVRGRNHERNERRENQSDRQPFDS